VTEVSATAARVVPVGEGSATEFSSEASTCPVHNACQAASGARPVSGTLGARAAYVQPLISRVWRPGDRVRWRDRIGVFGRDVGDSEHAEIVIGDRTYRVRVGDLA
jgi:hypothetical protein